MKYKLLLVEDERTLSELLTEFLEAEGYEVLKAFNGEEGLNLFKDSNPDICIFDIMIPKLSGFSLLEKVRSIAPEVPILILTAKLLKEDVIKGLKLGADDYVTKPFNFQELNLRLQNILKRKQTTENLESYTIGNYKFNYNSQILELNDKQQRLTSMEANMLHLLYEHKNKVIERKEILQNLWGNDDFFNFRSIDVFISKLRKYLSKDNTIKIISVRGKGYKLIIY